jgi:hypothetical protein
MGRLLLVLLLVAVFTSTSFAQETPAFEGSFGYSFLRNFNSFNRHGWVGSAAGNVNNWLGIKGEVGANYSDSFNSDAYSFLAGPQVTFRSEPDATPWVHFLVGVMRTESSFRILAFPGPIGFLAAGMNSDCAIQPGGGIDFWLQPHFGVRIGADYRRALRKNLNDNDYFQLRAGIVFRFGSR